VANAFSQSKKVKKAYVYFNNTVAAAAINNALYLERLVTAIPGNQIKGIVNCR